MNNEEIRKLKDKGPYEHTLEDNINMYDNFPYERDINLSGPDTLFLVSGNIIKYYRYKIGEAFNIILDK